MREQGQMHIGAGVGVRRATRFGRAIMIALCSLIVATPAALAKPAPTFQSIGTLDIGERKVFDVEFDTGNELLVVIFDLPVDVTAGSGLGLTINTLGSVADTELALYGPDGVGLLACNDDGRIGSWGDPVLSSVMNFGDLEQGDPATGWNGETRQTGREAFVNPIDLPAGSYVLILSGYEHVWDQTSARRSAFEGARWGKARLTLNLIEIN